MGVWAEKSAGFPSAIGDGSLSFCKLVPLSMALGRRAEAGAPAG